MEITAICFFIILILIVVLFGIITLAKVKKYNDTSSDARKLAEKARKPSKPGNKRLAKAENDIRYMRDAGVAEEELPFAEIIYDTGDGYDGEIITYNSRINQFYCRPYMWHIDDSQEFEEKVPCSPERAVSIIANCYHDSKRKIPAIKRVAELSNIDVSKVINRQTTKYYCFEDSNNIVKVEGDLWYKRDREKHQWVQSNHWMGHFYDAAYAVTEIDYDENEERIISYHT